jgi:hypothetical protein
MYENENCNFKIDESQLMMQDVINESDNSIVKNALQQMNEMELRNIDNYNDRLILQFEFDVQYLTKIISSIYNLENSNMEIIFVNNILILRTGLKNNSETNDYSHNIYLQNTDKIIIKNKNTNFLHFSILSKQFLIMLTFWKYDNKLEKGNLLINLNPLNNEGVMIYFNYNKDFEYQQDIYLERNNSIKFPEDLKKGFIFKLPFSIINQFSKNCELNIFLNFDIFVIKEARSLTGLNEVFGKIENSGIVINNNKLLYIVHNYLQKNKIGEGNFFNYLFHLKIDIKCLRAFRNQKEIDNLYFNIMKYTEDECIIYSYSFNENSERKITNAQIYRYEFFLSDLLLPYTDGVQIGKNLDDYKILIKKKYNSELKNSLQIIEERKLQNIEIGQRISKSENVSKKSFIKKEKNNITQRIPFGELDDSLHNFISSLSVIKEDNNDLLFIKKEKENSKIQKLSKDEERLNPFD